MISPLGVDRYSMPFFAEPHPDTEISCLPGCYSDDNPPKYPSTTCSRYMLSRFAETYAYRRQSGADRPERICAVGKTAMATPAARPAHACRIDF